MLFIMLRDLRRNNFPATLLDRSCGSTRFRFQSRRGSIPHPLGCKSDQKRLSHTPSSCGRVLDCLAAWWRDHQLDYRQLEKRVIDLNGGSVTRSDRTQFIKRIIKLAQRIELRVRLIYHPPYHSKYNPIVVFVFPKGTMLGSTRKLLAWCHFRFS